LQKKFFSLVEDVIGKNRAQLVLDQIESLETIDSVKGIVNLFSETKQV
jgi:hypothetical protein